MRSARDKDEVIEWARKQAQSLTEEMLWIHSDYGDGHGYWKASDISAAQRIDARAIAGLEFLRVYSGRDSEWFKRATAAFDSSWNQSSRESGARQVGHILLEWSNHIEADSFMALGVDERNVRKVAATDLMEQVRMLNEDADVHVAAPTVLAGAAIEIALRSLLEEHGLTSPRPGISAMKEELRKHDLLSKQDVKDLEQISGIRNLAAHGQFDELSKERSGLMEQQVNLFLSRLEQQD